jgi:outer membrane protein OmpA-like peptidoglycan-associated protein
MKEYIMNKYLSLGMAACLTLALSACAPPPRQGIGSAGVQQSAAHTRLANLKAKIEENATDDFGEFLLETHRASAKLEHANAIYQDLSAGRARGNINESIRQGEAALDSALHHRNNAKDAFMRLLSFLDDTELAADVEERLSYLESIHALSGEEIAPISIYFGFGSAQLNRSEEEKILVLVKSLHAYPIFALRLISYADTVGSKARNLRLAEQRNYSVIRALHREGLPVNTLVSIAVGQVEGPSGVANADDRRVEIIPYVHGRDPQLAEALAQIEDARRERDMQRQARDETQQAVYEVEDDWGNEDDEAEESTPPAISAKRRGR